MAANTRTRSATRLLNSHQPSTPIPAAPSSPLRQSRQVDSRASESHPTPTPQNSRVSSPVASPGGSPTTQKKTSPSLPTQTTNVGPFWFYLYLTNVYVQLLQKRPKSQLVPKAKKSAYKDVTQARENVRFQQLGETQAQKKQCEQDRARIPAKQPQSNPAPSAVAIKQARKGQHVTRYHARSSPPLVMEEDPDAELDEADGNSDAHNKCKSAIMFKSIILTKLGQTLIVRKKEKGQNWMLRLDTAMLVLLVKWVKRRTQRWMW